MPSSTEYFRQRRSEHLGHSLPVWPRRSLNRPASPVFLARRPCSWMRLLEHLSPEVQPSFTVSTRHLRPRTTRGPTLMGFSCPLQRIKHRRSTAVPVSRSGSPAPFQAGIPPAVPQLPATVPPSGFLNLSVTSFSPMPSHHFQAGNARGVSPFRGFPSHAGPYGSPPPACPPDVSPLV